MTHVYRQSGKAVFCAQIAILSFSFTTLFIILPVGPNFYWKIGIPFVSVLVCLLSILRFFKLLQKKDAIFINERTLILEASKDDFFESLTNEKSPKDKKEKQRIVRETNLDEIAGFALCDGNQLAQGPFITDGHVRQQVEPALNTMFLFGGFALSGLANASGKSKVIPPDGPGKRKKSYITPEDREMFLNVSRYLVIHFKNGREWVLKATHYTPTDLLALLSELETLTHLKAACPSPLETMNYKTYEKTFWMTLLKYGIASFSFALAISLVLLLVPSPSNGVYYLEALLVFLACFASLYFAMLLGVSFFDGKKVLPKRAKRYLWWNGIMMLIVLSLMALVVKIL